ncbi:MAG: asparagine synthase (glutamine-hydrolyzing) [Phycisphaerales bacterium]
MCGIAGVLRVTPAGGEHQPIPESWLDALDAAIAHRGPDGCGRFRDSVVRADGARVEVALVHRRLSIIDHAGGAQPMVSERGKAIAGGGAKHEGLVAVVFNGCIYNHRELRAELEKAGRVFVTDHSDTEVLIHGWREWAREPDDQSTDFLGLSGVHRANGMFAAAIWDRDRAVLIALRDSHGEKPLWTRLLDQHGSFAFSSGAASLAALPMTPPAAIDRRGLVDWCSLGVHDHRTPWREVWQIEPSSHTWSLEPGAPDDRTWWRREGMPWILVAVLPALLLLAVLAVIVTPIGLAAWLRSAAKHQRQLRSGAVLSALDSHLRAAVESRLEADVPLGCFLSGGIDSSLIAHYAKRARPDITTLCMRMPDARYDESAHAAAVARHLGTKHVTLDVRPSAAADVVHLIEQLGLPFADSSLLPAYWLCKAAREHVKVALSGDGGDERFMGYQRHAAAKWLPMLRLVAWAWPTSRYDERDPTSREAKMARLVRAARGKGYTDLVAIFPSDLRRKVFRARGIECERARFMGRGQARRFDLEHYLPGDLLRKTDTASMSVGLEVRCPFLDRDVAGFAGKTPIRVLMRGNRPKALLRELAARYLPREIVERPKQGFAIPISEWFRSDFGGLRTLLIDVLSSREPFGVAGEVLQVDMRAVREMVDEHMENRRDHGQRLYALMVLGVWARGAAAKGQMANSKVQI